MSHQEQLQPLLNPNEPHNEPTQKQQDTLKLPESSTQIKALSGSPINLSRSNRPCIKSPLPFHAPPAYQHLSSQPPSRVPYPAFYPHSTSPLPGSRTTSRSGSRQLSSLQEEGVEAGVIDVNQYRSVVHSN